MRFLSSHVAAVLSRAAVAAALLLTACNSDESPTAPPAHDDAAPSFLINDGAHSGLPGFYFLPPMVPQPTVSGTFDPDLAGLDPTVHIYKVVGNTFTTVATFTRSSTPAITLNLKKSQYQVTWDTKGLPLGNYNIQVIAGAAGTLTELGSADVKLTRTQGEANKATTDQQIGLVGGDKLQITFRIETGIQGAVAVSPAPATIKVGAMQAFTATVRDLHGVLLAGKTIGWSFTSLGAVVSVTPTSGLTNGSGEVATTVTAGAPPGTGYLVASTDHSFGTAFIEVMPSAQRCTQAAPPTIIDLGTLGGSYSEAQGINDNCQVAGSSYPPGDGTVHAYRWQNGTFTDLGSLGVGGTQTSAAAINNSGQVVGQSRTTEGFDHAFLWQNGTMIDLGTLAEGGSSIAFGINDHGQVVGQTSTANGGHAFLWQNGTMTDLGTLPGGDGSSALDINNNGQVVGWSGTASGSVHAFLWQNGTMIDLGTLGGTSSTAQGLNNLGQVVGVSTAGLDRVGNPVNHAFLWQNGTMTDLGTLTGYTYSSSAEDINDSGQAVGVSSAENGHNRAFLWRNGIMTELPTLGGDLQGYANGINGIGEVVGQSFTTGNAAVHANLWSGF